MTKTEKCSFIDCINPVKANGLCNSHNEQRRAGKVLAPLRGYKKQDPVLTEAGLASDQKNHPKRRAYRLRTMYNLTVDQFDAMLAGQGGCCAICRADKPGGNRAGNTWAVDHDHADGSVRGLLCHRCNRALGLFRDDPSVLRAAADYLETWGKRHATMIGDKS